MKPKLNPNNIPLAELAESVDANQTYWPGDARIPGGQTIKVSPNEEIRLPKMLNDGKRYD